MKIKYLLVFIVMIVLLGVLPVSGYTLDETVQSGILGEGNDFATLVFRNPWDMDDYTDISQWLNHAGPSNYLVDITVQDGVFSARSTGDYSEFFPLYPGHEPGVILPGTGAFRPINPQRYSCFYMAMKSSWSSSEINFFNVLWAPNRSISEWVNPNYVWGIAAGNSIVNGQWKLYQLDLNNPVHLVNKPWSYQSYWQALRVNPSLLGDTSFSVDWIRLTDCTPVYYSITGLPAGVYSLWLGTGSPEHILVQEGVTPDGNGRYQWDVQGLEAGEYQYYVKTAAGGIVAQGTLTVDSVPVPTFITPSPFSGEDYSTLAGNPWDMQDNKDIVAADCTNYSIQNGILSVDTPSSSSLPPYCVGGLGEADPKLYLNSPVSGDISQYRYLSFRHDLDGPWSMPDEGMIIRWIWEMSGLASRDCLYVSHEIALEVVWKNEWIDMHNPLNGTPVEVGGLTASSCPFPVQWKTQPGSLYRFRLDPNENVFSSTLHQEFDWIRLTKVPSVLQGNHFPIQVSMNKSPDAIRSITFYYTTDVNQPMQNLVDGSFVNSKLIQTDVVTTQVETANPIYLPIILNKYTPPVELPPVENEIQFQWDTDSVTPGEYYICAVSADGYNTTIFCSEAPVQVIP